jgi:hypothetical protein
MCLTCSCGIPDATHGDDRNIVLDELEQAAEASDISVPQAASNIVVTLNTNPSSWMDAIDAPAAVSIDVDGTLAMTLHGLCAAVNAKCKTQYTYFDCTAQEKAQEFQGDQEAQRWAATFIEYDTGSHRASKGFNKALAPDFAAIAAVQAMYAAGVYVHVSTHRDSPLEKITSWWLKKWQVPYHELHVGNTSKEDLAEQYQQQGKKIIFADDSIFLPQQLAPYDNAFIYLLRRPNTFHVADKGDNYTVVETWQPMLEATKVAQGVVPQLSEPIANKRFRDPGSTQEQDALGRFTDGTSVDDRARAAGMTEIHYIPAGTPTIITPSGTMFTSGEYTHGDIARALGYDFGNDLLEDGTIRVRGEGNSLVAEIMQPMTDAQISTLRTGIGDYAALSNPISSSPANFLIEAWVSNQASSDGNGHYVSFSGAADSRMDVGRAIAGANSALGVTNKSFGDPGKFSWLAELLKSFGDAGNTQGRNPDGTFGAGSSTVLPAGTRMYHSRYAYREGMPVASRAGESGPGVYTSLNPAAAAAMDKWDEGRKETVTLETTQPLNILDRTTSEGEHIFQQLTGGLGNIATGLQAAGYDGVHYLSGSNTYPETTVIDASNLRITADSVGKGFGDPGSTQTREPNGTFGAAAFHSSQQGRYTVSTYRNTAANRNALHAERTAQGHDAIEHESTRYPGVMVRDTFHNTVDADGSAITVVRDENGNIIGGAQFYPGSTNGNAYFSTTTITDFFPNGSQSVEDRGQGAGRAALQEIAQVSANAGVGMSLLGSITAPEFYQHMGFDIGDTSQGQSGYGTLSLEQTQALASKMLTADMMKGFGDPGSTQEQDALGHFTDGTGVQGLWFARTSPYAKDFGDKGHFVPTASQKQLDAATAALAAHGMTVDDIMRLQQAALEKGEGVAQAAGISPEQTAAWYATEQEMADAWVDHGYSPLQEAGMVAATTANVKFSETYANDTPNFAAGTTTYANFTAAASCAAYVSDNPELPITEEDAERINAASTGYNLDTGKIGMTPSGLDEFGGVPIPGGQNAVVATVNDDGTPILDENGDPIVVHANDLSDQQLGKYISMAGNSLIPGVAVGYPNSLANAVAIARGADPTSVIQGNKESSFMSNFAYPTESDTTTMDSHMGAISLNANGADVTPGTVVQGDDGKLTITPSQGGFLTNLPVVDSSGNPVLNPDGTAKTYNEVTAFLGKSGGYVTLNNITLQVAANNNMVGNNAQALMWISDTNPKDVQSMKAAKITNAVWLPPYLPDSDEEPDTDKLTATPPPLAMRCVVTSANVNHAPWRKAASKSFGSPGNTQSRVARGEFGPASTPAGLKGNEKLRNLSEPYKEHELSADTSTRAQISGLRTATVSRIDGVWQTSATDHSLINLTLQDAAAMRFGSDMSDDLQARLNSAIASGNPATNITDDQAAAYIDATYQATQQWLADNGITEVTLYRGVTWDSQTDADNPLAADTSMQSHPAPITVTSNPLTSWTYNAQNAESFANGMTSHGVNSGAVIMATIPASSILSVPATGMASSYWQEVVVITPADGYDVTKIPSGADYGVTKKSAYTMFNLDGTPLNEAWLRTHVTKSFGDPGNTQDRVAHGEFGMAEGAPNQSAADKKLEDKAIAHFGAADELQGQQFITPNGTILNFEGDGHDRIKEVQQR